HGRVREPVAGTVTVRAALRRAAVDVGVLEPQFRRLSRSLGKLGRRQGRPGQVPAAGQGLLERLQAGTLAAARTPPTPRGLLKAVLAGLDPAKTIGAADGGRVTRPGPAPADPLEPVLAAPAFPQPMVEPLRELGQEWILPGLDRVPPNSVSLAVTNRRFVEAY